MIAYIVKYQNNYVSSYLFLKNFTTIIKKGVKVQDLLNSNVFQYKIEVWPNFHSSKQEIARPYSGSIFSVCHRYQDIFGEPKFNI